MSDEGQLVYHTVVYEQPKTTHVLHLLLTVMTLGLWGIVWITVGVRNVNAPPRRCGFTETFVHGDLTSTHAPPSQPIDALAPARTEAVTASGHERPSPHAASAAGSTVASLSTKARVTMGVTVAVLAVGLGIAFAVDFITGIIALGVTVISGIVLAVVYMSYWEPR